MADNAVPRATIALARECRICHVCEEEFHQWLVRSLSYVTHTHTVGSKNVEKNNWELHQTFYSMSSKWFVKGRK